MACPRTSLLCLQISGILRPLYVFRLLDGLCLESQVARFQRRLSNAPGPTPQSPIIHDSNSQNANQVLNSQRQWSGTGMDERAH